MTLTKYIIMSMSDVLLLLFHYLLIHLEMYKYLKLHIEQTKSIKHDGLMTLGLGLWKIKEVKNLRIQNQINRVPILALYFEV